MKGHAYGFRGDIGEEQIIGLGCSGMMAGQHLAAKPFQVPSLGSSVLLVGSRMHVPTMYFHLQLSNSLRRTPVAVSRAKIGFMGSGAAASTRRCSGAEVLVPLVSKLGVWSHPQGLAKRGNSFHSPQTSRVHRCLRLTSSLHTLPSLSLSGRPATESDT